MAPAVTMERTPEREVVIPVGGGEVQGELAIPAGATGLVVLVHGSGSSRMSPRNRLVADVLGHAGLGTLLFDLLTEAEARRDAETMEFRFDVPFLAGRLVRVLSWLRAEPATARLRLGLLGASTGAAVALVAAAERPGDVAAVAGRGGRPDLAASHLPDVRAPVLLIVGGEDRDVAELNREALDLLGGPCELAVVPGATHLFEEPGTLDEAANLAAAWFVKHLGGGPPAA